MTDNEDFLSDLHRIVECAHRATSGSATPPADLWQQILAEVKFESQEGRTMNTPLILTPSTVFAPTISRQHDEPSSGVRHYANLAATLLMIAALAVGGWFALSQQPQGGPGSRFAAITGTPEGVSPTCDVEPLSVDRVMEIVKNPMPFVANGPSGNPEYISVVVPESAELFEYDYPLFVVPGKQVPDREQFKSIETVANDYLSCLLVGTQGQVWNFYSAINIQGTILADFPVFANEQDVRARIEERRDLPAIEGEGNWQNLPMLDKVEEISINRDRNLAILNRSDSLDFEQVVYVGVILRDSEGKALLQTNGEGRNLIPNDPVIIGTTEINLRVTLVKPRNSDNWQILPSPSLNDLGFGDG